MKRNLKSIIPLSCSQCGGITEYVNGQNLLNCKHCGTRLLVIGHSHLPQFAIKPKISKRDVYEIFKRCVLLDKTVNSSLRDQAELHSLNLVFIPLLEVRDKRVQIFRRGSGPKKKALTKLRSYRDLRDTSIYFTDTYSAQPLIYKPDWGIEELNISGLDWLKNGIMKEAEFEPFDPVELKKTAHVVETLESEQALKAKYEALINKIKIVTREVKPIERKYRLIYFPMWIGRYKFRGSVYPFSVDAVAGRMLYGLAPQLARYRAFFAIVPAALGGLIFSGAIKSWQQGTMPRLDSDSLEFIGGMVTRNLHVLIVLVFFVLAVIAAILAALWTEFRYQGLVEFRKEEKRIIKVNKPPKTFLEKLEETLFDSAGRIMESWTHRYR